MRVEELIAGVWGIGSSTVALILLVWWLFWDWDDEDE